MPTEVIMPALGMAQETGLLIAWLKNEGDHIERGDILMEVETDKATMEVEATATGTLANVTAKAGEDVPVGSVIALILAEGESAPTQKQASAPAKASQPAKQAVAESSSNTKTATPVAMRMAEAHGVDVNRIPSNNKKITRADVEAYVNTGQSGGNGRVLASPKARRLARENSLDLSMIAGSGPGGAVLADDVLSYQPPQIEALAQSRAPMTTSGVQTGNMWRRMAHRLTESWQTVPHFYLKREIDVTAFIEWRTSLKARSGVKITYTDLLVKVVAGALRQHPFVNGQWNGEGVVFNDHINIGLAVAVDEGLLVPVIPNADQLGLSAIAQRRQDIVERAQSGKVRPDDLQGGTFTISNLGMFGIDEFSAIVNPPQAAILAVGNITDRLVPVEGQAVVRPMMTLTLSCDHRAVDGARGAQFLATLVSLIQQPLGLLD